MSIVIRKLVKRSGENKTKSVKQLGYLLSNVSVQEEPLLPEASNAVVHLLVAEEASQVPVQEAVPKRGQSTQRLIKTCMSI